MRWVYLYVMLLILALIYDPLGIMGCASEADQRQHWQDCGNVYHEECVDVEDFRACEYEYYKECINAG